MSYNNQHFQEYVNTAGKITIITALSGVLLFTLVFLLNIGAKEFKQAVAQGIATTTITVLNTPPQFATGPFETPESSTTTPTNSGDNVTWTAVGDDPSGEDYFLLICDGETASPTANPNAPPSCGAGDNLLAVSATTTDNTLATAATTTYDGDPTESFVWFAWVCDATAVNPRCNANAQQGTGSTSSPFNVNHRPTFTGFWDDSPADPGTIVTFSATSTDSDTDDVQDTLQLHVCTTNSFNTVTNECDATTLATSTFSHPDPTASYTIPAVRQDDDYAAYGFIVDIHGHESVGVSQGTDSILTVNNVPSQVLGGSIDVNGGADIVLVEGVETTGFTLEFEVTDANSCDAVGGGNNDEYSTSTVSIYRNDLATTSCDAAGDYNANNCYPSQVGAAVWNLQCTASSTTCTPGGGDDTITVECTFPLWYIADPTNGPNASSSIYFGSEWTAGIVAVDDDFASSTFATSTANNPDVIAVTAINLLSAYIPYPALEPGDDTGTLSTTTTAESTGNTGLDHGISGTSMCNGYTSGNLCDPSATSTIPDSSQEFALSGVAYGAGTDLSSTTPATLLINIPKTTATSTPEQKDTFWGIGVPGTITFAGSYTGENTFTAIMSDPSAW